MILKQTILQQKKIEPFTFDTIQIHLWIPDLEHIQNEYVADKAKKDFPFWAKVWPSAIVLTEFLKDHPLLISNKKVLELAAGLGLPSIYAAHFAESVLCSDYISEAVGFISENIKLNKLQNMQSTCIDWHKIPSTLKPDVLLLSDINYNPSDFTILIQVLKNFLQQNTTIILSTPQRLVGKPFITELLPFCEFYEERFYEQISVNVLVLKQV